jgi:hypothetical protein
VTNICDGLRSLFHTRLLSAPPCSFYKKNNFLFIGQTYDSQILIAFGVRTIAQILIACGVSTITQIGVFEICGIVLVMTSQESA